MRRYHDGYILFSVLVFMLIATWLSVTGLASIKSTFTLRHAAMQRAEQVYSARRVLEAVMMTHQSHCVVPLTLPKHLAQQPLVWWWQHACIEEKGGQRYFYVMEALDHDPCAMVFEKTAAYFRLTLFIPTNNERSSAVVLQATGVTPESTINTCEGKTHAVTAGMQRWREL